MFKNKKSLVIVLALLLVMTFASAALAKEKAEYVNTIYGCAEVEIIQVDGVDNVSAQNRVNSTIKKAARNFAEDVQEGYAFLGINSTVMYHKNKLLSIHMRKYFDAQGAAHLGVTAKTLTFNLETGEVYRLEDLFQSNSDYRERINAFIKKDIAAREITMLESFAGIDGNQEFYIAHHALVVYYQNCRYTPYAAGFLEFDIPYSQLNDIFKDEFKKRIV